MVTKLLAKAFQEAAQLPAEEQEAFAAWILAELQAEQRWEDAFARSEDGLARLADEALTEHRHGHTEPLDPGRL